MLSQIDAVIAKCRSAIKYVVLFSVAINVLSMFMPLYSLQVLDRVASTGNMDTLLLLTLIAVSALSVMTIIEGARKYLLSRVGGWMEYEMSRNLILGSFVASANQHRAVSVQVARDLSTIKTFVTGNACTSILDAPWSVLFFVCICFINPATGVVTLIGIVLQVALALLSTKITTPMIRRINEGQSRNFQDLDVASRSSETIEAMGIAGKVADLWLERQSFMNVMSTVVANRSNAVMMALRYVRMLLQIATYCAGMAYALTSGGTVGGVIACSILIGKVMAPFDAFIGTWQSMISARMAFSRLKSIQGYYEPMLKNIECPTPVGDVRVDKVVVAYPTSRQPVLRGVSMDAKPGEIVCIVGASGAGKTTLLRTICGVMQPISGLVSIDNIDVRAWDKRLLGSHIGYVGQDSEFFETTVRDNIARLDKKLSPDMVIAAARNAGVHDMILTLPKGYDTIIGGSAGMALSAGQKQRLAMARSLYGDIRLLVMDEPNSHLDHEGEQQLMTMLQWAKEKNMAIIITTHKQTIAKLADKLVILQYGVATVRHQESLVSNKEINVSFT